MDNTEQGIRKLITKRVLVIGWMTLFFGTGLLLAAITHGFSKPIEIAKNFAAIPFLLLAFVVMLRVSIIYWKKEKS